MIKPRSLIYKGDNSDMKSKNSSIIENWINTKIN